MANESNQRPAIILGNGPSLGGFDFSRLADFDVFGMNAAYRYWDRISWYPRYYACLDTVVGLSHVREIGRLIGNAPHYGIRGFLLREDVINELSNIKNLELVENFDNLQLTEPLFSTSTMSTGSHTAAWATILGYKKIYLLGIDCNYVEIVPEARLLDGIELEIASTPNSNPNYFFSDYQQAGDKYNIPNPDREVHLESWREIAHKLPPDVRILNANLASRVDAFDFCRFEDVENYESPRIIPCKEIRGEPDTFDSELNKMVQSPSRKNIELTDPLPEKISLRLKSRSPVLYRATQLVFWLISEIASKPLSSSLFLVSLLSLIGAPFALDSLWSARDVFWIIAGVLGLSGLGALMLLVINDAVRLLILEIDERDDAVRRGVRDALMPLKARLTQLEVALNELQEGSQKTENQDIERIREELATLRKQLETLSRMSNR